jgi:hypothetical protein
MKISIVSRLGNVALNISAIASQGEAQVVKAFTYAMTFLLFHKVGSKVFGKKGGHSRDEKFSAGLAKDVESAIRDLLSEIFEGISVATSEHIPTDPWDTLRKQMKSLEFSDADIERIIADKKSAGVTPATPAQVEGEVELS